MQPWVPRATANDNSWLGDLALRGIRIAARGLPLINLIDLLKWLYDSSNDMRGSLGIALNGWTVNVECNLRGTIFSQTTTCSFCCVDQLNVQPLQYGTMSTASNISSFESYYRNPPNLPGPWYRQARRYGKPTPGATPARLPDLVLDGGDNLDPSGGGVNAQDPYAGGDFPDPLPWDSIPDIEPNLDAPEPIQRKSEEPSNDPWVYPVPDDPFVYPPNPGPDVVADPYPRPLPGWWRDPVGDPVSPPQVKPQGQPRPSRPSPLPRPQSGPVGVPIARTAPGHRFRKPTRGEKETKQKVPAPLMAKWKKFGHAFGEFTEASEAIDCAYSALPWKIQKEEKAKRHGKKPDLVTKSKLIYQHAGDVDANKLLKCMLAQHAIDALIGKANRAHANARKLYGIRGGYMSRLASKVVRDRPEGF